MLLRSPIVVLKKKKKKNNNTILRLLTENKYKAKVTYQYSIL